LVLNLLKSLMKRGETMSEEKPVLEVRLVEDVNLKDRVYGYVKSCEGQLDPQLCATDLHVPVEDVMKAIAILESEGKIKVEATPTVTEPEKPADTSPDEVTMPETFPEEMPMENAPEETAEPADEHMTEDMPPDFTDLMTPEEHKEEEIKPPVIELPEESEVFPTPVHAPSNEIVITQEHITLEKPKVRNPMPTPTAPPTPQTTAPTELEHAIPPPQAITMITPPPDVTRSAICPKCGLPTDKPMKYWCMKGHAAKKPIEIFLYKCPVCGNLFRSADTLSTEA